MSRSQMSEREKAYLVWFLVVPLWPLGIAMRLCDAVRGIGNGFRTLYRRLTHPRNTAEQSSRRS